MLEIVLFCVTLLFKWAHSLWINSISIFSRGAEPSHARKMFLTAPEKTAMLSCKITLPDSPHQVIISKKILDFWHFISLDRINSVLFHLINTKKIIFFSFLAAGFCPKNLYFARKIMVLPESGGCSPLAPWLRGSYTYVFTKKPLRFWGCYSQSPLP